MTSFIFLLAMSSMLVSSPAMAGGCKRITAALEERYMRYLFFGGTVIQLSQDLHEYVQGDSYKSFYVANPEAAVQFDNQRFFFSGKFFMSTANKYRPINAAYFGGAFFKDGLDAAGNVGGYTYFFKGCVFVAGKPTGIGYPVRLPSNFPCPLDAALTVRDELWLFKDNLLWKMTMSGIKPGMPVRTDSEIYLNNIRLCAPGEKEE